MHSILNFVEQEREGLFRDGNSYSIRMDNIWYAFLESFDWANNQIDDIRLANKSIHSKLARKWEKIMTRLS